MHQANCRQGDQHWRYPKWTNSREKFKMHENDSLFFKTFVKIRYKRKSTQCSETYDFNKR